MGRLVALLALLAMFVITSCARTASSTTPQKAAPAEATEAQRPKRELRLGGFHPALWNWIFVSGESDERKGHQPQHCDRDRFHGFSPG